MADTSRFAFSIPAVNYKEQPRYYQQICSNALEEGHNTTEAVDVAREVLQAAIRIYPTAKPEDFQWNDRMQASCERPVSCWQSKNELDGPRGTTV